METLQIYENSNSTAIATQIANILRNNGTVVLKATGAFALQKTIVSIALAREYIAPAGVDLVAFPSFAESYNDEDECITTFRFSVELL